MNIFINQIKNFSLVGIAQNFIGYLIYIVLTYIGIAPVLAISILYPLGATFSFIGNKKYTFINTNSESNALGRFVIAHLLGLMLNIILLKVLVETFGFPHQLVQLIAMLLIATFLFIAMKYFIFSTNIK